jgi:two-component system cell cycle response regulator DivK
MEDPSNWNVLIVDDEPDNIGVLELVFGFHNMKVRTAQSGQAGLVLLREEIPTFILVDIQMPDMTGYELFNRIRENPDWATVPVIAITAHTMSGDAEKILEAGFNGYIAKPVNVMTLLEEVQTILEKG